MNDEITEHDKYVSNLESLFMITMYKLGNDVEISDKELASIKENQVLDVETTKTGLRLRLQTNEDV